MSHTPKIEHIPLKDLVLDFKNPRFADLYTTNKEQELIEYLINNEAVDSIVNSIVRVGYFYEDCPLWVIKHGNHYLVKDGNRRCAAVKALQQPELYGINQKKMSFNSLPVLIYEDEKELSNRIIAEHANSTFRSWERIAKALEIYRVYKATHNFESLKDIDSKPSEFLKLANFYYAAVKIAGEDIRRLFRRGRGESGGKSVIFERLFSVSKYCGYTFTGKPAYDIEILDMKQFKKYLHTMVQYLTNHPFTTYLIVNKRGEQEKFLRELPDFEPNLPEEPQQNLPLEDTLSIKTPAPETTVISSKTLPGKELEQIKRKSIKKYPTISRKKLPQSIDKLVKECYDLNSECFVRTKSAMSRVLFELILKYVVDNTQYNGKVLKDYHYFDKSMRSKKFTDFSELKRQMTALILDKGTRQAMELFDLEKLNPIIHNYKICAKVEDCDATYNNLMFLIDFLLQDEEDLLKKIDVKKLEEQKI